jgi:hypothetical protein
MNTPTNTPAPNWGVLDGVWQWLDCHWLPEADGRGPSVETDTPRLSASAVTTPSIVNPQS